MISAQKGTYKVGSTNPNINNICDGLSCVALPLTAANSLHHIFIINIVSPSTSCMFKLQCDCFTHMTEALHLLQHLVNLWHYILAIYHDGNVGMVPQSHMEHSAPLRTHNIRRQKLTQRHTHTSKMQEYSYCMG